MTASVRGLPVGVANPLKELRERLNLTLNQVAYRVGVSKQFIIKAEQGVYTDPSDTLVSFYAAQVDLDTVEVSQKYYAFQRATRKANYGRLIEPWVFSSSEQHPFIRWRQMSGVSSAAGVCKLYCIHPAVVNKFENRSYLIASAPEQLTVALLESGYKPETLERLERAFSEYKALKMAAVELINDGVN